ncbi:hypothetical protein GCM10012285_23710 [Streptomyces kronopolitis]|uniref:Uncharacterized protein n=1 Tax=Streptomyces kronopolitis TaxID=1612435 RepID=A0ABQ2JAX7_9ACTN|nr:hypothetical protein GCM10012285_23710 [Streptomyces kronopolitis]
MLRSASTLVGDRWQRLPEWAAWFSEVGYWAADLREGGSNSVVALSVPTRDYLAVLLAYGVVNQASQAEMVPAEPEQDFEQAKCLPVGACVRVIPVKGPDHKQRVYTGVFGGAFSNHHGQVYELAGSRSPGRRPGPVSWFPADDYRLQLLPWPDLPDAYAGRHRFSEAFEIPAGAGGLVAGQLADFYGRCSLHSVVIGAVNTVLADAQVVVAAPGGAGLTLQGLLRMRAVHSPGSHYRSVVLSSRGDPEKYRHVVRSCQPVAVVLDGAAAVRRWLGAGLAGVTVAVVERTSPTALAAVDVLYENRRRSVTDLGVPRDLANRIPPGVELLAWRSRGTAR